MQILKMAGAAIVALGFVQTPASALPGPSAPQAGSGLVIQVTGCHRDVRRHFVPELGRRAWHYHRGSSCRPIEVEGPSAPPAAPADCHRDVRRHYVPEYGRRLTHRHRGPNCRIQIYDEFRPGRPPTGACVTVGGAQFCIYE